YIHLGADEFDWVDAGVTYANYVQWVADTEAIINARGKTAMGWNPAVEGYSTSGDSVLQVWSDQANGGVNYMKADWFDDGRKMLLSPTTYTYYDYAFQSSTAYNWDPSNLTVSGKNLQTMGMQDADVLGIEGCMWGVAVTGAAGYQFAIYPNAAATLEKAWSPKASTTGTSALTSFNERLGALGDRWQFAGWNFDTESGVPWKVRGSGAALTLDSAKAVTGEIAALASPGTGIGSYTATVDWGDGSAIETATISGSDASGKQGRTLLRVSGSHTYPADQEYTGTVTFKQGANTYPIEFTVTPQEPQPVVGVDLKPFFNVVGSIEPGTSPNTLTILAGWPGYGYSATSLEVDGGLAPGGLFTWDGIDFTWPAGLGVVSAAYPDGEPNAVQAAGQVIPLSGKISRIGFLTANSGAVNNAAFTVKYTDGTSETRYASFVSGWNRPVSEAGPPLKAGFAACSKGRIIPDGTLSNPTGEVNCVSYAAIEVTGSKEVESITLPVNNVLNIWAIGTLPVRELIATDDANAVWSPLNWFHAADGSYAQSNAPGAYVRVAFTGTSLGLRLAQAGSGRVSVFVDGSAMPVSQTLAAGDVVLASGLSDASASSPHTAVIYISYLDGSRWSASLNGSAKISGFLLDAGESLVSLAGTALEASGKSIAVFGDSITEGYYADDSSASASAQNTQYDGYASVLGRALGVEYAQIGFNGQGWSVDGQATAPFVTLSGDADTASSTWRNYWSGESRLDSSGQFIGSQPDAVFVAHGVNDAYQDNATSSTTRVGQVAAKVKAWLEAVRQAAPNAALYVLVPFISGDPDGTNSSGTWDENQAVKAELAAGVTAYQAAHPTDDNVWLMDLGVEGFQAVSGVNAHDYFHPNHTGHQLVGTMIADLLQPAAPTPTATPGPNKAEITWDAVPYASGYTVQYRKSGETSWTTVEVEQNETSATVGALAAGSYEFTLQVHTALFDSPTSATVSAVVADPAVSTAGLAGLVSAAEALGDVSDVFTAASVQVLSDALAAGKAVLAKDPAVVSQAEVDSAVAGLNAALAGLTPDTSALEAAQQALADKQAALTQAQADLADAQADLAAALAAIDSQADDFQAQIDVLTQQAAAAAAAATAANARADAAEAAAATAEALADSLQDALDAKTAALNDAVAQLNAKTAELNQAKADLQAALDELDSTSASYAQQVADLQGQIGDLEDQVDALEIQVNGLEADVAQAAVDAANAAIAAQAAQEAAVQAALVAAEAEKTQALAHAAQEAAAALQAAADQAAQDKADALAQAEAQKQAELAAAEAQKQAELAAAEQAKAAALAQAAQEKAEALAKAEADAKTAADKAAELEQAIADATQAGKESVNVPNPVAKVVAVKVKLAQKTVTLVKGKTFTVPTGVYYSNGHPSYRGVEASWKSSNPLVASVREDGKITALKAGKATITATAKNAGGKTVTAKIKVTVVKAKPKAKAAKIVAKVPKTMTLGQVFYINAKYTSAKAAGVKIKYASSKFSIVSVDKAGRLKAGKKGTDVITIKAGKVTKKYKITVK
ncbi:MAG: GDSL-type esterase/lipase family protein, partial [Propionibacteriaceae bacterium]|nr:GDSL-type esterase/lipase family protein [Propionibacteriaceae bacterium]